MVEVEELVRNGGIDGDPGFCAREDCGGREHPLPVSQQRQSGEGEGGERQAVGFHWVPLSSLGFDVENDTAEFVLSLSFAGLSGGSGPSEGNAEQLAAADFARGLDD